MINRSRILHSQLARHPKPSHKTKSVSIVRTDTCQNEPPQKLSLAFSTADVVVLGWRLGHLADQLQENSLAAVRVLPKRYAEVDKGPFIASITITPIAKAAAGKG